MSCHTKKYTGFSLIELMVVVVIIGILAGIAIPSFNAYIENGRRAEGKAFALDIASRQERHFTQFSRYASGVAAVASAANLALPNGNGSENNNYTVAITNPGGDTSRYLLRITPQITDPDCGVLRLDNTGARGAKDGAASADEVSFCWR